MYPASSSLYWYFGVLLLLLVFYSCLGFFVFHYLFYVLLHFIVLLLHLCFIVFLCFIASTSVYHQDLPTMAYDSEVLKRGEDSCGLEHFSSDIH